MPHTYRRQDSLDLKYRCYNYLLHHSSQQQQRGHHRHYRQTYWQPTRISTTTILPTKDLRIRAKADQVDLHSAEQLPPDHHYILTGMNSYDYMDLEATLPLLPSSAAPLSPFCPSGFPGYTHQTAIYRHLLSHSDLYR